jgi:TonB-linked SusC/RagA family outer membrane protein
LYFSSVLLNFFYFAAAFLKAAMSLLMIRTPRKWTFSLDIQCFLIFKTNVNMRKFASLLTMLMLFGALAYGQNRTISGRVTDEKGEALPGASVRIKGTRTGVAADNDGQFRILAKTGDVLTVTGAGLETTEVTVGAGNTVTIAVKRTNTIGTEVVVTALGVTRQPKELGYSATKIKNSELTQAKVVNLQNGLTGKVSGLNVQTVNNGVFADTRITLRGIRSLTGNNQPLLVVDGVPMSLGFINSLNPNDITDVTVLKGNTAAAVYGQDGSNGVIVVTTRKGVRGNRPVITVSNTTTVDKVAYMPEFQTRFGSGSSEDANGFGIYDPIENQCYGPEFDGSVVQIGRPLADGSIYQVTYQARPKEKTKFWDVGVTTQNDVSFSTGDERGTFYLSAQDANVRGIQPNDRTRRSTFRLAGSKEYGVFRASFSLNYVQNNYSIATGSGQSSAYWLLINTPMHIPITRFKDWRNDPWANHNGYFSDYYQNPYEWIDTRRQDGRSDDLLGNIELNLKPLKWLNVTYRLGTTVSSGSAKSKIEGVFYSPYAKASGKYIASTDQQPSVSDGSSFGNRITSELFANVRKTFHKFSFDLLAGQSLIQTYAKSVNVSGSNLVIPTLFNVANRTGEPGASESNSKRRTIAAFGKLAVGFDEWVYLEVTGRNEWDSRLAKQNRSLFYPGASVSFLLNEAIAGLKASKVLSYLKLRGAYAKSGNVNLGIYQLESTFANGSGFPYGTLPGYTASNTALNPDIKPEFVNSKEIGVELGFFKNRVNVEITAYRQKNTNQVIDVQTSSSTGYTATKVNAAQFTNEGLEFDLRLTPVVKFRNGLNIDFKGNFSVNDSRVEALYQGLNELSPGNSNYAIIGAPAYIFKLTDYLRDPEGHVIVDAVTGLPSLDPVPRRFGRTLPKYILGLSPTISWKGLTLTATGEFRGGHQVYHGIGPDMDFTGVSKRSATNGRRRFVMPNSVYWDGSKYVPNTSVAVYSGGYGFWEQTAYNRNINSNYLTSANFWKVREIALTWDVPTKVVTFTKIIKKATVGFVARNVFTWLPDTNQWTDPEFSNTTGNVQGVNNINNTPPVRTFGGTITLTF